MKRSSRPMQMSSGVRDTRALTIAISGLAAWGVVLYAASLLPEARLWSINHLAFASSPVRWLFGAGLVIALIYAALPPGGRQPSAALDKTGRRIQAGWGGAAIVIVGVGLLAWLLREREAFLGDGTLRALDAMHGSPSVPSEFLPTFLATIVTRLLPISWQMDGYRAYRLISVTAAVLLAAGLWWLAPKVTDKGRRTLVFWALTFGSARILAGYIESYPLTYAAITLWAMAAMAWYRGQLGAGWVIVFWATAMASHVTTIVLIPATVWLFVRGRQSRPGPARTPLLAFAAVAVSVGGLIAWAFHRYQIAGIGLETSQFLLPILPQPPHHYGVVSPSHLADFVNQWLLLAPGFLIACLVYFLSPRSAIDRPASSFSWRDLWDKPRMFWILAMAGPLGVAFLVDPKLGWARDWDLFCILAAPALAGAALWLDRTTGAVRRVAASTAVLSLALWMSFSVDANADRRRFEALLRLDPSRADYGHEIMAQYYRRHNEYEGTLRHYQDALLVTDNVRYRINIAAAYFHLDSIPEAERWYRDAIARDSTQLDAWHGLAVVLQRETRLEEALAASRRALAIEPANPELLYETGSILASMRRFEEALPYLEEAVKQRPLAGTFINGLGACYLGVGRLDDAREAFDQALKLTPDEPLIWLNAALVALARRDTAETRRFLLQYEHMTPATRRHPNAQRVADSLTRMGSAR